VEDNATFLQTLKEALCNKFPVIDSGADDFVVKGSLHPATIEALIKSIASDRDLD
jgi:hypothetical protein